MKIEVPGDIDVEDVPRYCEVFRAGYLTMTKRYPYREETRALWPEAYDRGQAAGYLYLNQPGTLRRR